jgi:hypothetical protein
MWPKARFENADGDSHSHNQKQRLVGAMEANKRTAFEVQKHLHRDLGVVTAHFDARKHRGQLSSGDTSDTRCSGSDLIIATFQIAEHHV